MMPSEDGIECIMFAGDEQFSQVFSRTQVFVLFYLDVKATPCPGKKDVP